MIGKLTASSSRVANLQARLPPKLAQLAGNAAAQGVTPTDDRESDPAGGGSNNALLQELGELKQAMRSVEDRLSQHVLASEKHHETLASSVTELQSKRHTSTTTHKATDGTPVQMVKTRSRRRKAEGEPPAPSSSTGEGGMRT